MDYESRNLYCYNSLHSKPALWNTVSWCTNSSLCHNSINMLTHWYPSANLHNITPSKLAQVVKLLTYIQEDPSLNLDKESDYPDWSFFMAFLSPSMQMLGQYFKTDHNQFLPFFLSNTSFINHPTIWCYTHVPVHCNINMYHCENLRTHRYVVDKNFITIFELTKMWKKSHF